MYLVKYLRGDEPEKNSGNGVPVDLTDYLEVFDFFARCHYTHHDKLAKLIDPDPSFVADLVAAVIAQLAKASALEDAFLNLILDCYKAILLGEGYQLAPLSFLQNTVNRGEQHVMLVLGCQGSQILRARVRAAYELWKALRVDSTIVFAGGNPAVGTRTTVKIPNEAMQMWVWFEEMLRESSTLYRAPKLKADESSRDTNGNVRNLFEGGLLTRRQPSHLFFVSSSFHLIRLADIVKECLERYQVNVQSVVLVGAEDPKDPLNGVVELPRYVKPMLFEIYNCLLSDGLIGEATYLVPSLSRSLWGRDGSQHPCVSDD